MALSELDRKFDAVLAAVTGAGRAGYPRPRRAGPNDRRQLPGQPCPCSSKHFARCTPMSRP